MLRVEHVKKVYGEGTKRAFEACGGQIVQKIWPPLGTKDFGPYIPTIKADADAIFTLMVGPMSLQFPKQLAADLRQVRDDPKRSRRRA